MRIRLIQVIAPLKYVRACVRAWVDVTTCVPSPLAPFQLLFTPPDLGGAGGAGGVGGWPCYLDFLQTLHTHDPLTCVLYSLQLYIIYIKYITERDMLITDLYRKIKIIPSSSLVIPISIRCKVIPNYHVARVTQQQVFTGSLVKISQ